MCDLRYYCVIFFSFRNILVQGKHGILTELRQIGTTMSLQADTLLDKSSICFISNEVRNKIFY